VGPLGPFGYALERTDGKYIDFYISLKTVRPELAAKSLNLM